MRINLNARTAKMALPLAGAKEDKTGLKVTHLSVFLYWSADRKRYILSVSGCEREVKESGTVIERSSPFSPQNGRKVLEEATRYSAKALGEWARLLEDSVAVRASSY